MYELIQISEHDYYIDCPAKMGIVRTSDTDVVMIDSGSDKDAGKKALKCIEANGWKLVAVYNTHSHADHIGGNRLLQDRTGCKCYAYGLEWDVTCNPILEPALIYGGYPHKDNRNKFLMAQASKADPLTEEVLPEGWKLFHVPGHSYDMVGFITADGNAYIGDAISSQATISKYGIIYTWNIGQALESLEYLKTVEAKLFVPAHAPVTEDITKPADLNISGIYKNIDKILDLLRTPESFDELLKGMFDGTELVMNATQHVLTGSTVRAYLSYLYDQGRISYEFRDNIMYWKRTV
ncbi:MAG: MBL fold metallo-hydrolase [Lachnospiraceae bacterium]|nr:MBL fold metallo-hydrolase [Lachnospiraceae bacterium]